MSALWRTLITLGVPAATLLGGCRESPEGDKPSLPPTQTQAAVVSPPAAQAEPDVPPAVDSSAAALPAITSQKVSNGPVEALSAEALEALGDPFFRRVIQALPQPMTLGEVEAAIQPKPEKRHTFVVHEAIADPTAQADRRAVIAFTGDALDGNVMISVSFTAKRFEPADIEAWGWDSQRARYNYYRLDSSGGARGWKLRDTSVDATTATSRSGRCIECHINGAPIMKELARPWNNWASVDSPELRYLKSDAPEDVRWGSATSPFLTKPRLAGAESLEIDHILPAIQQFNGARVAALATPGAISSGRQVLTPVFSHTEVNLISSVEKSGLSPHSPGPKTGPGKPVRVPGPILVSFGLMAPAQASGIKGLGIVEAQTLGTFEVTGEEYVALVKARRLQLGARAGDADFAFFSVGRAFIDDDFVARLIERDLVSANFVAAALAVDLETPIYSTPRRSLLAFVPDQFTGAADLTAKTLVALRAVPPGQATADVTLFRERLEGGRAVDALREDVVQLSARIRAELDGGEERRAKEVERIFLEAVERRAEMEKDTILRSLDEGGDNGLLPRPAQ